MNRRWKVPFVMMICLLFSSVLAAANPDLPRGTDLMDRMVTAEGGKAAFDRLHTRVLHGRMEIPAKNQSSIITIYQAAPNKERKEIEAFAAIEVTDGEI